VKQGSANELFLRAVAFAVDAHGRVGQERKGTDYPYAVHPLRVGEILAAHEYVDDVVAAGILHNTIEDAGVTPDELRATGAQRMIASRVDAS
jgi:(p)ppGpp synthase/HD superfamily hydrolase